MNIGPGVDAVHEPDHLVDYAAERVRALCAAAGFGAETHDVVQTVRGLLMPWADVPRDPRPKWLSEISDDNTPIELSVAITDNHAEVRMLFEPQASEPTVESFRRTGLAFHERLEREFGAELDRFRAIEDLFLPPGMDGPFAVWNAVVFEPGGHRPSFKAYLNPQARGAATARELVQEGLHRLGLGGAWTSLRRSVLRRSPDLDELKYFALDLSSQKQARVKVYVRHHDAGPEDLEAAAAAAEGYSPGESLAFARAMRGGDDRLRVRAAFSCSSFAGGRCDRPAATTVYVPVCAYAQDDAVVSRRVHDYLSQNGMDPSLYDRIIHGFANRPLDAGVGMQSWVALRRYQGRARLTVYLATEANRVHAPGEIPAPTTALFPEQRRRAS